MGAGITLIFEVRETTSSPWTEVDWDIFVPRGEMFRTYFGVGKGNPDECGRYGGRGWPADVSATDETMDNLTWLPYLEVDHLMVRGYEDDWMPVMWKARELAKLHGEDNVRLLVGFTH